MQWTDDKVQEEVIKLLQPFNPKGIEITPDTDLSADLMMDSVAAMNLVMEIEDRFEIRSEEHTSELQSLMRISYAVFCLKNKKNKVKQNNQIITNTYYDKTKL